MLSTEATGAPSPAPPAAHYEDATGYDWGSAGKRGAAASRLANREKGECPTCHYWYKLSGLGHHIATCKPAAPPRNDEHNTCPTPGCSRLKASRTPYCFRCELEWLDPKVRFDFAVLTLLDRARINTPREELERDGMPTSSLAALERWIAGRMKGAA